MFSNYRVWWQKPQLVTDQSAKRVTWLELFFDLIFVVVISRLAHHLTAHPDARTFLEFLMLFIPVWWTWIGITYYNERFETFDLSFRVFTFLQLLAVAGMAANADYGMGKTQFGFALAYALARFLLMWMWLRAGRHNPQARPVSNVFAAGFGLSSVLWAVGAFNPGPLGLALKALGLTIDLLTPFFNYRAQVQLFPMEARKLPERFGLFVIIVLGESLVGVVNGLAEVGKTDFVTLTRFVLAMLLGFAMWWLYFDFIGRREPQGTAAKLFTWAYLHLPLVVGIVMVSGMTTHAIAAGGEAVDMGVRWLMACGFALYHLTVAALEYTVEHENILDPKVMTPIRIGTAVLGLLTPLLPIPISGMVAILVGLMLIHMVLGVRGWIRSDNMGRVDIH